MQLGEERGDGKILRYDGREFDQDDYGTERIDEDRWRSWHLRHASLAGEHFEGPLQKFVRERRFRDGAAIWTWLQVHHTWPRWTKWSVKR